MNRPEFTREQEDWICFLIDEWYKTWEGEISIIPFKFATHLLKDFVCGMKKLELLEKLSNN